MHSISESVSKNQSIQREKLVSNSKMSFCVDWGGGVVWLYGIGEGKQEWLIPS